MGPLANPNDNYKILSDVITTAKANHIPKKLKKIDRRKFKKTTMDDRSSFEISK